MKYINVTITPEEERALSNLITGLKVKDIDGDDNEDISLAYKWIAYVRGELYKNWTALPKGSHLKSAYAEEVWAWNDEDLY